MDETIKMSPVDELLEIGARMKRDKARLQELCRQIADATDPAEGAGFEEAKAVRRTARRTVTRKTTGRPAAPGDKQYWKKVTCPVCGESLGSRVYEDERYPVLHKNPESHEVCKGSFQAVTPVTGLTSHE